MIEVILLVLAVGGAITTLLGHVMVVRASDSTRPVLSFILLCMIPALNLVYLVRLYSRVKRGAFIAIAGMWLTVPYAGVELWHDQDTVMRRIEQRKMEIERSIEKQDDADAPDDTSLDAFLAWSQQRTRRVIEKEKLIIQLNARLTWWFHQLEQRRAALPPDDAAALQEFNAEAAAYASLNTVAKEKNAELIALRSPASR